MGKWDKVVRQTVKASGVNTIHVHGGVSRDQELNSITPSGNQNPNYEEMKRASGE